MRPTVDLPQPLSPTRPKRLAALDVERDAIDRIDVAGHAREDPGVDREMLLEIVHLEQRAVLPLAFGDALMRRPPAGGRRASTRPSGPGRCCSSGG